MRWRMDDASLVLLLSYRYPTTTSYQYYYKRGGGPDVVEAPNTSERQTLVGFETFLVSRFSFARSAIVLSST
jgi:hypothetical protein